MGPALKPNVGAAIGWGLAVIAVAVGYAVWGWQGVLLGVTITVFWLLLEFSRALRVMRRAGQNPVGAIDSAVMLHLKLHPGMKLLDILKLTRSLGRKTADAPETFRWTDAGGDAVEVQLHDGRVTHVALQRAAASPP